MYMKRFYIFWIALLVVTLVFCISYKAQAATGLSIQPVKISQTLKPGEQVSGTILLSNASDDDVSVDITVQDFVPTAGSETYHFVGQAPGVSSVKEWITIPQGKNFIFKKGESREIAYTIKAPVGAEPGGHFGAILFKAIKASEVNAQLRVGTQVGMLILVSIPGNHLEKGSIRNFKAPGFIQGGPVPFVITFENTGTVHFEPKGTISIKNMFGKEVAEVPIEGQIVLPTGIKDLTPTWQVKGLLLGRYTASAEVFDGEGNKLTSQTVSFWAIPLWYVTGFIVAVIVLYGIIKFLKSRVKVSISLK
jgi:hypothetical protein